MLEMELPGVRRREEPGGRFMDECKEDMEVAGVTAEEEDDRVKRRKIKEEKKREKKK